VARVVADPNRRESVGSPGEEHVDGEEGTVETGEGIADLGSERPEGADVASHLHPHRRFEGELRHF